MKIKTLLFKNAKHVLRISGLTVPAPSLVLIVSRIQVRSVKARHSNSPIFPVPRSLDFTPHDLVGKESADHVGVWDVRILGRTQNALAILVRIGVRAFVAVESKQRHESSPGPRRMHDSSESADRDLTFDTRRTTLLSRRGKPFQIAVLRVSRVNSPCRSREE
jgi:hypothetical protein